MIIPNKATIAAMVSSHKATEPFPVVDNDVNTASQPSIPKETDSFVANRPGASSSLSSSIKRASKTFEKSDLPEGFFAASGGIASSLLAGRPIARSTVALSGDVPTRTNTIGPVAEENTAHSNTGHDLKEPAEAASFPNGYHFPPKHSFGQSTKTGLLAFWRYATTPVGFFVTLYGLNVVAWGGMLFLLLCNACK